MEHSIKNTKTNRNIKKDKSNTSITDLELKSIKSTALKRWYQKV